MGHGDGALPCYILTMMFEKFLPTVISAAEIHVVEKERKARTILLMAIPKEHLRRFHGMDDAKEIWEAIRTSSEGLEKGYDIFQQLLSQVHGAEVSTEDANHKFLRSLPLAWSNLAMTMRTKPNVDTLSIDDLYNNLRVFEQELTSTTKSHSKSNTNKVKSGHTGAYSTYTPSTSSNNIPKREVPAGFADEVIYSLFAKQSEDLDLLHEDLEQIDDMDIEEMDINWQIAMIAIRMKKFYKKTGRRVRIDGNKPVGFDKKKLEYQGVGKKEQNQNCLLTMDDGVVNWGEHIEEEVETNHALMAINSNNEDHPLKNMEDRGIFDSGCSGHMTGNKDHLDDFEECKGGSVTFGGSKGYITGKGRIRVGNLDFDSVSFVKKLGHFNLFSIS
ncbi:hypothetical protein Tco_1048867 [Tanacetum coccineum]